VPLIAKALSLNMLHNYAKSVFANPKGHEDDLLITCCVDKAMMGWHAERSVSVFRERSGGQGFLAANFYSEFIASAHAGITAEGDNRVLMTKVVKDLLSIYMKRPDYFYTGDFVKITDEKQLFCLQTLNTVFLTLEKFKLNRLINKMTHLKSTGKTNYEIMML
jgi:acyl-CoA oxidase